MLFSFPTNQNNGSTTVVLAMLLGSYLPAKRSKAKTEQKTPESKLTRNTIPSIDVNFFLISKLPNDSMRQILEFFNQQDLMNLIKTNKALRKLALSRIQRLWSQDINFIPRQALRVLMQLDKDFNEWVITKLTADIQQVVTRKRTIEFIIELINLEKNLYFYELFAKKLSVAELITFGKLTREEVAMQVLSSTHCEFSSRNLGELGGQYPKVATFILRNQRLHGILKQDEHELSKVERSSAGDVNKAKNTVSKLTSSSTFELTSRLGVPRTLKFHY